MLIFNKMIDDTDEILYSFEEESCKEVKQTLSEFIKNKKLKHSSNYEDILTGVINHCKENLPSPMNMSYPNCTSLTVGINFFTLKLNPNFGFGVKILTSRDGKVRYELSLVFEKDIAFAKNMPFYTELLSNKWEVKEIKSHKPFNKSNYKKKED